MGRPVGVLTSLSKRLSYGAETRRCLLSDGVPVNSGPQFLRVGEEVPQDCLVLTTVDGTDGDLVDLLGSVREVAVDRDHFGVGRHEEGRILQRVLVAEEL